MFQSKWTPRAQAIEVWSLLHVTLFTDLNRHKVVRHQVFWKWGEYKIWMKKESSHTTSLLVPAEEPSNFISSSQWTTPNFSLCRTGTTWCKNLAIFAISILITALLYSLDIMIQCAGFESVLSVHALGPKYPSPLVQLYVHCEHLNN